TATVLLAAYQYLLGFWSGHRDVVVGTPVAGRPTEDVEQTIGLFVNTVAIRAEWRVGDSFADLVDRVRDRVFDAHDHQDVPFDEVVRHLAPERAPGRTPVFQHWFDHVVRGTALALPGVDCARVTPAPPVAHFDLELHVRQDADGLEGTVVHAADLFDRADAERFAHHYRTLLAAATAAPDAPLDTYRILEEEQRRATPADPVTPAGTAVGLVDRVAAPRPDAPAVVCGADVLTYRQLVDRADGLADALATSVGPEDVVAVHLPKGVDLVVALLAVLKSGAAYLPLAPDLPPARVAALLADSGAKVLLTTREWDGPPLPPGVERRFVEERHDAVPAGRHRRGPAPEHLMYLVYTSGSTGTPKGVAVTHGMFSWLLAWHLDRYRVGPADRVTQVASISFDAAGWEIWPALAGGAVLDLVTGDVPRSARALVDHFAATGTTITFAPTALAEQLIESPLADRTPLRLLLTGGDVFRPKAAADPGIAVVNHYGPTETTVVATATGELRAPWSDNSIGLPVGGARCHVLDDALRPVPDGAVGELHIGGPAVARGYRGRPAATAEAFVPDPFADTPGARLYRTGDLVRRRPDGALDFVGRKDRQVQVRGHRVEPAEVEAVLLAHPGVAEAVVDVRGEAGVLTAYVVPRGDVVDGLAEHVAGLLPPYLVPAVFLPVPGMPLTANGKVDRAALPDPGDVRPPFVAPRPGPEEVVAGIWAEVLEAGQVGARDDFFHLGGHSLAAARVITRVNDAFDLDLPLGTAFEHRTVADLAGAVERAVLAEVAALSPAEVAAALADDPPRARPGQR
ncbi:MAG: amino acid adenylation domain-containing protein, partial [Saccharothrix sp.]|nr:amino acid adenylation domain-containing protein [Saccharothrix sp.]